MKIPNPERPFEEWEINDYTAKFNVTEDTHYTIWIANDFDHFRDWEKACDENDRIDFLKHLDAETKQKLWDKIQEEKQLRKKKALEDDDIMDEGVLAKTIAEFMLPVLAIKQKMTLWDKVLYRLKYKGKAI